jgi:hypothetical protein
MAEYIVQPLAFGRGAMKKAPLDGTPSPRLAKSWLPAWISGSPHSMAEETTSRKISRSIDGGDFLRRTQRRV